MDDIETTRLILRRFEPEALQAGLSGNLAVLEQCLGATVPTDLAEDLAALNYARAALAADPDYLPWSVRALILKSTMQMVGHVRFHSRPDPDYLRPYAPNAVEFGYVVFPAYRRRRYAQEALTGVMYWARQVHGVDRFVASVSPANLPSLNLISKFGFQKIAEAIDPVDGIEHIYLRDATPRTAAGPRHSS